MSKWTKDAIEAPHTQRWMGGEAHPVAQEPVAGNRLVQFLYRILRDHPDVDMKYHLAQTDHADASFSLPFIQMEAEHFARHFAHPATPAPVEAGLSASSVIAIVMDECWKDREMKLAGRIEARILALRAQSAPVANGDPK